MEIAKSLFYFIIAGIFEIGGGYLVWLWLREGKPIWFGLLGAAVLILSIPFSSYMLEILTLLPAAPLKQKNPPPLQPR